MDPYPKSHRTLGSDLLDRGIGFLNHDSGTRPEDDPLEWTPGGVRSVSPEGCEDPQRGSGNGGGGPGGGPGGVPRGLGGGLGGIPQWVPSIWNMAYLKI